MRPAVEADLEQRVAAIRRFNRFYTRRIGVLRPGFLGSRFSLAQVRVLYELAHRETLTAAALSRDLSLDPGYLSRILRNFEARRLVARTPSGADGREMLLSLTPRGRDVFVPLSSRQRDEIVSLLRGLAPGLQDRLVDAMQTIERLLEAPSAAPPTLLRLHGPGDLGWIAYRHGALCVQEYGLGPRFEARVAETAAKFLRDADRNGSRCWVAEHGGIRAGGALVMRQSGTAAAARLLFVEPWARGAGLGARLLDACVRFAGEAGYRHIRADAAREFRAARGLLARGGFRVIRRRADGAFGRLMRETWTLRL